MTDPRQTLHWLHCCCCSAHCLVWVDNAKETRGNQRGFSYLWHCGGTIRELTCGRQTKPVSDLLDRCDSDCHDAVCFAPGASRMSSCPWMMSVICYHRPDCEGEWKTPIERGLHLSVPGSMAPMEWAPSAGARDEIYRYPFHHDVCRCSLSRHCGDGPAMGCFERIPCHFHKIGHLRQPC